MNAQPYELIDVNMVRVCAWCHPGDTIKAKFPELAGCEISHGICPDHAREQRAAARRALLKDLVPGWKPSGAL